MLRKFDFALRFTSILICLLVAVSCSGRGNPLAPTVAEMDGLHTASDSLGLSSTEINDLSPSGDSSRRSEPSLPYAPDEVLVVLNEDLVSQAQGNAGVSAAALNLLGRHGLSLEKSVDCGWAWVYVLKILDNMPVPVKVAELEALPVVEIAEPNYIYTFCDVPYAPNDPLWENPSDSDTDPRTSVMEQWGPSMIGAPHVWATSTYGQDIVVCVIDSGIQVWHQDIADSMWINEDEIPDNGIDDDNNGFINDIYGWDTEDNDNDITEYNGDNYYHGTACAGVIAATLDNELGCVGISPMTKIMGIRIGFGYSFLSVVLQGLSYARDNGADVISMSFSTDTYSVIMRNSCNAAWDDGLILAASAGNDDSDIPVYPAAYLSVISVGGTSPFGKAWAYKKIDEVRISAANGFDWGSNYGESLELMGYGENYITTHGGNDHKYWDGVNNNFFRGTSNACPMVAAGAALLKSQFPTENNEWLRDRLKFTADDLDVPGWDDQTGFGRINLLRACLGPDPHVDEADTNGFVDVGTHDNQIFDSIHAVAGDYADTEDLFKFTATEDGYFNAYLDIWTFGEDLDMFLFSDESATLPYELDHSNNENHAWISHEIVGAACEAGQTYYIRVLPQDYGDSTAYTLTISYVQPSLHLEITQNNPGFIHLGGNGKLLGMLDFTAGSITHITELIFNIQGTMPYGKVANIHLYRDIYKDGSLNSNDLLIANGVKAGTNRIFFKDLDEEISPELGTIRFFLTADFSGINQDATCSFQLTSYKDVTTKEGIEIAYDDFPFTFGPYAVGVDVLPPTWDTTTGVVELRGRYESVGVIWNNATDPQTPPVEYNVYWSTGLPFDFATAEHEDDVEFWNVGDVQRRWIIPDLIQGQEYYVAVRAIDQAGNEDENAVVLSVVTDDIADSTWPQQIGTFDTEGDSKEVCADPANPRVFLADNNGGMLIIDVSDPAAPVLADSIAASGVLGVDYDGTYVYAACADGMKIIDPDGTEGAIVVTTVPFANALDLIIENNWAYVTNVGTSLMPVDVTDPQNPIPYSPVASGNNGYDLYMHAGYLYVATFEKIRVFDLTDPAVPVQVGNFGANQGHGVTVGPNDWLITAYYNDRKISIYDLNTSMTSPTFLGSWQSNSGYYGSSVVWLNDRLYFGTRSWGIEVLDITDPATPVEIGQTQTHGPDSMDTDGHYIYSAENEHGLMIVL